MNMLKFIHGNHGNKLFSSLAELWMEGKYCDCTLVADSVRIQLHKVAILAAWPSIMTSFSVTEDSGNVTIYLPENIKPDALSDFVSFLYNGEIVVTKQNIDTLENISEALGDDTLSNVCRDYKQSCLKGDEESKDSPTTANRSSEKDKHNSDLLNKVKKSDNSANSKRNGDAVQDLAVTETKKIDSVETCDPVPIGIISRDEEDSCLPNGSPRDDIPDDISIKSEPFDENEGKDELPDNIIVKCEPLDKSECESDFVVMQNQVECETSNTAHHTDRSSCNSERIGSFNSRGCGDHRQDNVLPVGQKGGTCSPNESSSKMEKVTKYRCYSCGASYSSRSNLRRHMEIHLAPHECACGATFQHKETLARHKRAVHLQGFPCRSCTPVKFFRSQAALSAHNRKEHSKAKLKCQVCDKVFGHRSHLKDHFNVHTDIRSFSCEICKKTFKHERSCKLHMQSFCKGVVASPSKSPIEHRCSVCEKIFEKRVYLKQHMQKHENLGQPCPRCGRILKHKSSMIRHISKCSAKL